MLLFDGECAARRFGTAHTVAGFDNPIVGLAARERCGFDGSYIETFRAENLFPFFGIGFYRHGVGRGAVAERPF